MGKPLTAFVLKREAWLTAIVLTAVALLSYADSVNAPFVFDDRSIILENPHIRITGFTPEELSGVLESRATGRPLADLSFAANFYLNGYNVFGYHAVNLLIHLFMGLLVWWIARSTLNICGYGRTPIPLLAAALWLVHPVHTQSVTYIVQRMNAMAAMFFMLALICYVLARKKTAEGQGGIRRRLFFSLCLLCGVFGLATKQTVATLPAVLLVYEWLFFQGVRRGWLKKGLLQAMLVALIIIMLGVFYLGPAPLDNFQRMYAKHAFTIGQRLLTEAGVVIYYVSLLLFPHPSRLNLDYDFPLSRSWNDSLPTVLAVTALLFLAVLAVYSARKNRLLSFAVLWFLITLAVESSIIGLEPVFEHRTYLPSVFPLIAIVALTVSHIRSKTLSIASLCLIITICCFWTYERNRVWSDGVRLWTDVVAKAPGKSRPYDNLGATLMLKGENDQAVRVLTQGLELAPLDPALNTTMATAVYLTGNTEKALAHCRTALDIDPGRIEARNTLGFILREKGDLNRAERCFSLVLTAAPDNFEALINMGLIRQQQADFNNALSWFQRAVDVNPASSKGLYYLGSSLAAGNRPDDAARYLKAALVLDPNDYRAHCMLAAVMAQQRNCDAAVFHYGRALEINPACTVAALGIARTLSSKKEFEKAQAYLDRALRHSPRDPALLWQAVQLLTEAGRFKPAAAYMEKLAEIHPDNPKLLYNLACLYARQNDTYKALSTLNQAIKNGYNNWSHIKTDKDLASISHTPYFKKLIR